MTEQILSEDEKNALLDGVSSGAVPVQSNGGPQYASVQPFEVSSRSRLVTDSYPRLQATNQIFAERLSGQAAGLLQCELEITSTGMEVRNWSDCCLRIAEPCIAVVFSAAPLTGNALIVLQSELVGHLVESFFGSDVGAGHATGGASFTPGELAVANLFCNLVLANIKETWKPLIEFTPERVKTEIKLDLVDVARDSDAIIGSNFELSFAGHHGAFHVLWPRDSVATLLPAFEGRKRERNVADDARWEQAIRLRLADAPVTITTCIGDARHVLGDLAVLSPGDVLHVESPRAATVLAGQVPILKGRFGVYEGRNAVEATEWLPRKN